jgi:hypothetical protein
MPTYIFNFLVVFPSGFPTNNLYTVFFSIIRATYPAYLILLDLIIVVTLGKEYKSQLIM